MCQTLPTVIDRSSQVKPGEMERKSPKGGFPNFPRAWCSSLSSLRIFSIFKEHPQELGFPSQPSAYGSDLQNPPIRPLCEIGQEASQGSSYSGSTGVVIHIIVKEMTKKRNRMREVRKDEGSYQKVSWTWVLKLSSIGKSFEF